MVASAVILGLFLGALASSQTWASEARCSYQALSPGNNLQGTVVGVLKDSRIPDTCCDSCQQKASCAGFSWNASAHTCTLVAADGWKVVPTEGPAKDVTAAILIAVEDQERTEDLAALWENHVATEFVEKDADEAVATMVPDSTVNHMPTMTGGQGTENLRAFYATHFIPKMPEDVKLTPIDRIISNDSVVDEFVFEFTHNVTMDWLLPGVAPTGQKVRIPFVAIIKFEGDKLKAERIYWDQASVLVQVGLLNATGLPVTGVEQAEKAIDFSSMPSNQLIERCLVEDTCK